MTNPLCSIIISSYNKQEYVGLAVESALSQTYRNTEVIVVDDGSTDKSLEVLESYRDRVLLIAKPNFGQASAMNRGFLDCHGEIVFFLDCDDLLDSNVVERVVGIWTPSTAKVHFRLRKIRGDGSTVDGVLMPPYRPLLATDVGTTFRRFGFYPAPPTTGNAFARRVLSTVMPLPEPIYRAWPDTPLVGMAPLFGFVASLEGTGGCWRETAGNYSRGGLDKVRAKLACDNYYINMARSHEKSLPDNFGARWPQHLKDKLILLKFSLPSSEPIDAITTVVCSYIWSVLRWPEYRYRQRLRFTLWAMAMLIMPQKILRRVPGVAGPNVTLT